MTIKHKQRHSLREESFLLALGPEESHIRSRVLDHTAVADPVNLFYSSPEEALERTFEQRQRNKSIDLHTRKKSKQQTEIELDSIIQIH